VEGSKYAGLVLLDIQTGGDVGLQDQSANAGVAGGNNNVKQNINV
jgi:hypothetical protein